MGILGKLGRGILQIGKSLIAEILLHEGDGCFEFKSYGWAIGLYENAIKLNPQSKEAWFNKALCHYNVKDYASADSAYRKAAEIDSDNHLILNNWGDNFYRQGKYRESIEKFDRAISLKGDYAKARYNQGLAYCCLEDYKSGIASFREILASDPLDKSGLHKETHNMMGLAMEYSEQKKQARKEYAKAVRMGDINSCFRLASSFYSENRKFLASNVLNIILKNRNRLSELDNSQMASLIDLLHDVKRQSDAEELYPVLLSRKPSDSEVNLPALYLCLIDVHTRKKDYKTLEEVCLEAKERGFEKKGKVLFALGHAQFNLGRDEEALRTFGRIPDSEGLPPESAYYAFSEVYKTKLYEEICKKVEAWVGGISSTQNFPELKSHLENAAKITDEYMKERTPERCIMKIVALTHDIERAFPGSPKRPKVGSQAYLDYQKVHRERSAKIVREKLEDLVPIGGELVEKVVEIIANHDDKTNDYDSALFTAIDIKSHIELAEKYKKLYIPQDVGAKKKIMKEIIDSFAPLLSGD